MAGNESVERIWGSSEKMPKARELESETSERAGTDPKIGQRRGPVVTHCD